MICFLPKLNGLLAPGAYGDPTRPRGFQHPHGMMARQAQLQHGTLDFSLARLPRLRFSRSVKIQISCCVITTMFNRIANATRGAAQRNFSSTAKVWLDGNTKVICQGMTGKTGTFHTKAAMEYIFILQNSCLVFKFNDFEYFDLEVRNKNGGWCQSEKGRVNAS